MARLPESAVILPVQVLGELYRVLVGKLAPACGTGARKPCCSGATPSPFVIRAGRRCSRPCDLSRMHRPVDLGQPDPVGGCRAALPRAAQRGPAGWLHAGAARRWSTPSSVPRIRCSRRWTRTHCVEHTPGAMMQARPFLPFALPDIGDEEIAEVVDTLKSGWVTTGPKAQRFEADFSAFLGEPGAACDRRQLGHRRAAPGAGGRWASARATRSSPPPTPSPPPPRWCATWAPTCGWWTSTRPR